MHESRMLLGKVYFYEAALGLANQRRTAAITSVTLNKRGAEQLVANE